MRCLLVLSVGLFLFTGCVVEEARQPNPPDAAAHPPIADPATLHKVADDGMAGSASPRQYSYQDPKTGTTYLMNPKWSVLPRRPPGLAKTSGLLQTWTDWSGQVETRIYDCASPTAASHQNSIGCQVEEGFILVGGGAWADYGTGPGALLWESRPLDGNLSAWVASSKDHISPNPHILHTYAIGLRLKGNDGYYIPKSTLLGTYISLEVSTSSPAVHVPDWEVAENEALYFGGGARTNWSCCGSFLIKDRAYDAPTGFWWLVGAKDHINPELTTITGYGIKIRRKSYPLISISIPNFGSLDFNNARASGNYVSTGVAVAYRDADPEYVITGAGAQCAYDGPGRMLFGIKPTGTYSGQFGAFSKDHKSVSAGYNDVYLMEVRKAH